VRIEIELVVAQESQKRILLGRGGDTITAIARGAAGELQRMWGRQVQLQLRVRVQKPP
jgi:GTPase Era involved in 16S rRNA processing